MDMYVATALVACLPPAAIVGLVSQVSPWSPAVIVAIASVPPILGYLGLAATFLSLLAFWSLNKARRLSHATFWVAWWWVLLLATATGVLCLVHHPCFAVAFLTCLGHALMYPLRQLVFHDREASEWFQAVWIGTALAAALCLAAWVPWVVAGWPGRQKWTDWPDPIRSLVSQHVITWKFAFVSWVTPAACAVELGLIALICWVRKRYVDAGFHRGDAEVRKGFVVASIKQLSGWLVAMVMVIWINAALNATGEMQHNQAREDMRDEVLGLAFLVFLGLALWALDTLSDTVDPEEMLAAVSESKVASETGKILQNDWTRSFVLLTGAVPIALCMACDRLFVCAQQARGEEGAQSPLARYKLHFWVDWRWTSVVVKALWLGVLYHGLVVGVGKVTTVLLSVVNESLASWPVFAVSAVMFAIGFAIFMFPASPGPPVYVVMGIVITSSALRQGWDFAAAVSWATLVAYAMKLAFTAAAQKFIGEPFASSDAVRQLVQIHTPYMRAIEGILVSEGNALGKAALLVGGPDWPVAVLCGMLRLSALKVLAGISPVLVQSVFPCVLSGALLLSPGGRNQGLAEVSLVVAGALQLGFGVLALYYVQEALERDYEKLTQRRPEDAVLEEMDEKAEALQRAFWREAEWELLPATQRLSLVCGLVCMEASLGLLLGGACFESFGLMSTIERDLGGSVLAIVRPLGWAAILLGAVSAISLGGFYAWAQRETRGAEQEGKQLL